MWDDLSIKDKAEVMKLAVRNGLYDLNDIKGLYNKRYNAPISGNKQVNRFDEGGDTYAPDDLFTSTSKPIREEDAYEVKAALADKEFQENLALANAITESNIKANSEYLEAVNAAKPRRHLEEAWEWYVKNNVYMPADWIAEKKKEGLEKNIYPAHSIPEQWRDPNAPPSRERPDPPVRASRRPNKGRNTGPMPQPKPSRAAVLAAAFADSVNDRPGYKGGKVTPLVVKPKEKDDSGFGLSDLLKAVKGVGNFIPGVNTVINAYDLIGALVDERYGAAVYNTADLATDFALSLLPYNKIARGLSTAKNIVVPIYDGHNNKSIQVPLGPLRPLVNKFGKSMRNRMISGELDRTLDPKSGWLARYLQKQVTDWRYMWPAKLPLETGVNAAFYFNEPE